MSNEEILTKLQKMLRELPSNQKNAEYLLEIGKIYFEISLASSIALRLDREVSVSQLIDWRSNHYAVTLSQNSYDIKPTIDSALLILNSYSIIGNYTAMIEFIDKQDLLNKFPNEAFNIRKIFLYALTKSSLRLQSMQTLYGISPEIFEIVQQKSTATEDNWQSNFNRLIQATSPTIFNKGATEDGFVEFCQELFDSYQRENNARDYLTSNIEWSYDYCFNAAIELHKESFMRLAMQMYALAFALNPSETESEFYCAVALHSMGEHQVAFQKLNQFTDNHPENTWGYIIAGNSCAITKDISGLEVILKKAHAHNRKDPIISLLQGFYLESKGGTEQALNIYKKCIQESNNELFTNIFNSRVELLTYE